MNRWVFSVYTQRQEVAGKVVNFFHHHTCAVLEANGRHEAYGLAMAIARKLFPVKDGWTVHNVCVSPIDNVVTLEGVQVTPE